MYIKNFAIMLFLPVILGGFIDDVEAVTVDVDIENFAFDPAIVVVQVGDTVRWTNQDTAPHTTTSDTLLWDSGTLTTTDQFEFTFDVAPGSYTYFCDIHAGMSPGTVIVKGCFLSADTEVITGAVGGTVNFLLQAGVDGAGRDYLMLGSLTGTSPGLPLPGGMATLPINYDAFTAIVITFINTATFFDFLGTLDGLGENNTAQLNLPPVPMLVGFTMDYAFAINNPWNCASNPVSIRIL